MSVLAADHRWKKPVRVPRPDYAGRARRDPPSSPGEIRAFFGGRAKVTGRA